MCNRAVITTMFTIQVTNLVIDIPMIIFIFLIQWTAVCFTVTALEESQVAKDVPFLVIEPITSREYGLHVIKRVQETLNLTCTVFDNSTDTEPRYNISWTIPTSSSNSKNRVVIQGFGNSMNLVVPYLEARDEGEYACWAQPIDRSHQPLSIVVRVNIKPGRKKSCGDSMFMCNLSKLQNCIHQRYRCDGYNDCQLGEDEDSDMCGESPCSGKVKCEDPISPVVRCIPKSWCCNVRVDVNCTTRQPLACCPLPLHKAWADEKSFYAPHHPSYSDMTVIQTTVYTVIGCAMVFMMVVTVLVIAICRVHMKRSLMTQCPTTSRPLPSHPQSASGLCDLDAYLNRGCTLDSLTAGCLVTYNINNGVQIVGHAIDPPPYCEVMCLPPQEGPPPPYTSRENLGLPEAQALLHQSSSTHCDSFKPEEEAEGVEGSQDPPTHVC